MKMLSRVAVAAGLFCSYPVLAQDDLTRLCYPKYKEEGRVCTDVYYDPDKIPFGLFDHGDVVSAFSDMSKYGVGLSEYVDNPIAQIVLGKAFETAANAGYGPILALGRFALSNIVGGGSKKDPIVEAVKVLLKRIGEAEEKILGRMDELAREEVINEFNGTSKLYNIYNSADTIDKRATRVYTQRLSGVEDDLDELISHFQGSIFSQDEKVKNYQAYIQLVSLRLLVLAEVERLAHYELYGEDMAEKEYYIQYSDSLKAQYQLVLEGVFSYINDELAKSDGWKSVSDRRFSVTSLGSTRSTYASASGRGDSRFSDYASDVRPLLFPVEKSFYDVVDTQRAGRGTISLRRGDYANFQEVYYKFEEIPYQINLSRASKLRMHPYSFYGVSNFNVQKLSYLETCSPSRYNRNGCDDLWRDSTQHYVNAEIDKHKKRAYYQFIDIYYRPTQEVLDKWWSIIDSTGSPRPKNDLDMLVDNMK